MRGRSLILPALALCCWLALAAPPAHAWRDSAGSVCSASPGDLSELTRSRHGAGGGNAGGGFSVSAVAAAAAAAAGGGFAVTVQGSGSYLGIVVTGTYHLRLIVLPILTSPHSIIPRLPNLT